MSNSNIPNLDATREFLTASLKEQFPELTIRTGTAFGDVVDMSSYIYSLFKQTLDEALLLRSLRDYNTMPEDQLDSLLTNWNVTRNTGNKSSGTIRMYFKAIQEVGVTFNTVFSQVSQESATFSTNRTYSFSTADMMAHVENNMYYCDVEVFSVNVGIDANISSGVAFVITGLTKGTSFDSAVSLTEFSGGVDKETNEEFYNRALMSFVNREQTANGGVSAFVKENFAWATDVMMVNSGSPYMTRDVVQDIIDFPVVSPSMSGAWTILTFLNKIRASYSVPHVAYKFQSLNILNMEVDGNSVVNMGTLPSLDALLNGECFDPVVDEFTQDDYQAIGSSDASSMVYSSGTIFEDSFARTDLFEAMTKVINSSHIVSLSTCEIDEPTAGHIRDVNGDFINKGVITGDLITLLATNENRWGRSGSHKVATSVTQATGILNDTFVPNFISLVGIGDTLHLINDAAAEKTFIIMGVDSHNLYVSIPSSSGTFLLYKDYWVTRDVNQYVDFPITLEIPASATILGVTIAANKYTFYSPTNADYRIKRDLYQMQGTGWKSHQTDIDSGAVRIDTSAESCLCLGFDPDKAPQSEADSKVNKSAISFQKLISAIGIDNAKSIMEQVQS